MEAEEVVVVVDGSSSSILLLRSCCSAASEEVDTSLKGDEVEGVVVHLEVDGNLLIEVR